MNKKTIITLAIVCLLCVASVLALTLTDVILDKDTSDKLVLDAEKSAITVDEKTAEIVKTHYDVIEAKEQEVLLKELQFELEKEIEILLDSNDITLIQEVLDDIKCTLYQDCEVVISK